jgi:serine/threonine protein kinase
VGGGGWGVVYKARQKDLDRLVAIKVVLHAEYASVDTHSRFRNEAVAVARLQHANIVQIHEIGEADGLPYFSLEYCSGGNLAERLKQGPMEPMQAARLVCTLAQAVQAAHDQKVIHRDLKPGNILFSGDGSPKVADFGLARRMDTVGQTASGTILGTPPYMAPEQARGKTREVGLTTDVYALGAILYECLTGRPPFREESAVDTLLAVVSTAPIPLRQIRSNLPHPLEAICLKCLEKDPANRPESAGCLADELKAFLEGGTCADTVVAPQLPAVNALLPRRWILGAGMALLVGGLVLGVWLLPRWGPAPGNGTSETSTATGTEKFPKAREVTETGTERLLASPAPGGRPTDTEVDDELFSAVRTHEVWVGVVQKPDSKNDLVLAVKITPPNDSSQQKLTRVELLLNDYRYDKSPGPNKRGVVDEPRFIIPRKELRNGMNHIKVQSYSGENRRGEASVSVKFDAGLQSKADLYGLCVGLNDYSRVRGFAFGNLNCSKADAEAIAAVLKRQKGSALYRHSYVDCITETEATAGEITARLKKPAKMVRRDDWFVLFLSGHGHAKMQGIDSYEPGTFFYLCADSDNKKPDSVLTSRRLYDLLARIPCRKLIILDTSRSGDVASTPTRDLTREGVPLIVFSACAGSGTSLEPVPALGNHALFTQCLLEALGAKFKVADTNGDGVLDLRELAGYVQKQMPKLLLSLNVESNAQTPVFYPPTPPALPFASDPRLK